MSPQKSVILHKTSLLKIQPHLLVFTQSDLLFLPEILINFIKLLGNITIRFCYRVSFVLTVSRT